MNIFPFYANPLRCSGVESKHTLMVSSNEHSRRKVFGQNVQPGHVEEIGDRFFACNGHAPAE